MNYYVITPVVFETLNKNNISFKLKSVDETKILISTTEDISNSIEEFDNITACSNYTFTNHTDWVGDGTGVEEMTIEEIIYIPEIDE